VSDTARISPTAHYTGYVWARNGLSHPQLATAEGRVLFESMRPLMMVTRQLGGGSLEYYLLARHKAIDALLERAIEDQGITQVLEVAAGFSPRGWRFSERYGDRLTYVETDLPEMAERKRSALERIGSLTGHHRVEELDALTDTGPSSLAALVETLAPDRGLAIITEGLLGYLPREQVDGIWRRFARALSAFAHGRYISDLHIGELQTAQVRAFRLLLSAFVRGQVHLHFENAEQAKAALRAAGFTSAEVRRATAVVPETRGPGAGLAHVVEGSTD
jgi:O-methyltransferase involved in polyketide biosynthesis